MKFWDTSALVPLLVDEPSTPAMRQILSRDRDVVVWMLTGLELLSTLARLGRATPALDDALPGLRLDAIDFVKLWTTVTHVEGVRRRAERLVGVHPLSAADAMQLGAALMAAADRPEALEFVTLDRNLAAWDLAPPPSSRAALLQPARAVDHAPARHFHANEVISFLSCQCRWRQVFDLARTKSLARPARGAWERCIAPATRAFIATSR